MTGPVTLTDEELKAAAYFAVGVSSEGSLGGRDMSYRLSFAGNVQRDGTMAPVGNSGYSFGTLQIDLGQHPDVARSLLDNYQRWAGTQPDAATLALGTAEYDGTLQSLQRTGREMRAAGAHDIDRTRLNRFLQSDAGRTFVHQLDTQHVNGVTAVDAVRGNSDSALERLQRTALYRNAAEDDQARLAGLFMKLENQSGRAYAPRLLGQIEAGTLTSVAGVKTAVDGLLPNQSNGSPDYVQSGADNTLRGVEVFNALRNARPGNPLNAAWATVIADPLMGPVAAHESDVRRPARSVQYDTVRSLFLTSEGSRRLIHALDEGGSLAEGSPTLRNGRRNAGFYASGSDFVHWNANGQGVACIGGEWRAVDPDALQRVQNRDGTVELRVTENGRTTSLLHVDPRARGRAQAEGAEQAAHDGPVERRAAPEAMQRERAAVQRQEPGQPTNSPDTGQTTLADNPAHPDFGTFNRIHEWVRGTGHWGDVQGCNVAAALYARQAADPLVRRVDQVTGGMGLDSAENVFAVYTPHGEKGPSFHAHVDGRFASQQPASHSLRQAEQFVEHRPVQDLQQGRDAVVTPRMMV